MQGLHGNFTPTQALVALLSGTDLQFETNNAGVLMVRSKNVRAALNEGAAASPATAQTVALSEQPLVDNPNASAAPEDTGQGGEAGADGALASAVSDVPGSGGTGGGAPNA